MDDLERSVQSTFKTRSSIQSQNQMEITVQKFRTYYSDILNQGGEKLLQRIFSQERELSKQLSQEEREIFLSVVDRLEKELLSNRGLEPQSGLANQLAP